MRYKIFTILFSLIICVLSIGFFANADTPGVNFFNYNFSSGLLAVKNSITQTLFGSQTPLTDATVEVNGSIALNGDKITAWPSGGSSVSAFSSSTDLSAQCDGSNKIFTVPEFDYIIGLFSTQFPFVYRQGIDFNIMSETEIELTSAVGAPVSGQTLTVIYGNGDGGLVDVAFSTSSADYWYTFQDHFSTTSADYWLTQQTIEAVYSTTSADYWKTQRDFFSTTSADYWLTEQTIEAVFSTTSADYWYSASDRFSTTSVDYWLTQKNIESFSTTSADYWISLTNKGYFFSTTSADYWVSLKGYLTTESDPIFMAASTTLDYVTTTAITLVATTSATYTGDFSSSTYTGYKAANFLCDYEYDGSHICSDGEILSYLANSGDTTTWGDDSSTAWYAEVAPGYLANANDCDGFTTSSNTYLGAFYLFNSTTGGSGFLVNCSNYKSLMCCK